MNTKLLKFYNYKYIYNYRYTKNYKSKLNIFKLNCYIYIYIYIYYRFNLNIYLNIISKYLDLKIFNFLNLKYSIKFITFFNINYISAEFISNFICKKLAQNVPLNTALKNALKIINNISSIYSFRIISTGKFSKKQRSTYIITNSKFVVEIPNGSITEYIDYSTNKIITKYGCCNIKVWLFHNIQNNFELDFIAKTKFNFKNEILLKNFLNKTYF